MRSLSIIQHTLIGVVALLLIYFVSQIINKSILYEKLEHEAIQINIEQDEISKEIDSLYFVMNNYDLNPIQRVEFAEKSDEVMRRREINLRKNDSLLIEIKKFKKY